MTFLLINTVLSVILLLQAAVSRDRYARTFAYLALFFVLSFYVVPLWIAAENGSVRLAGVYFWLDAAAVRSTGVALLVFSIGFAAADWIIKVRSAGIARPKDREVGPVNGAVEAVVALIFIGVAIYAFNNDLYSQTIEVRRDEAAMSYTFATFLMSTYYVGCFYVLRALDRNRILKAFAWTVLCLLISLNFSGRTNLLLLVSLLVIHYTKRPELSLAFIAVSVAIFLPLITHGKEIVYALMVRGDLFALIRDAYSTNNDLFDLFGNMSHVVVSFNYAPALIERFHGYRYFWDIPQGVLFYLRLFGIDMGDSLTYYNTEAILHIRQSVVPPGYMAFGYIQAGMFGVFVAGMIYRYLGFVMGLICDHIRGRSIATDFYLAFLAANTFYVGEPRTLVLTVALPAAVILALQALSSRAFRLPRLARV